MSSLWRAAPTTLWWWWWWCRPGGGGRSSPRLELHAGRPARGLSGVWTTFHLRHECEAKLLGIPFDTVMQAALLPVVYSVGIDFRSAARWTRWSLDQW
jgi:hypothetical protein